MKALIFDTETTGLIDNHTKKIDKQPEIIEFYGCMADLKTKKIGKEIDELIKPSREFDDEITKITGITPEMVMEKPPFKHFAPAIRTFIEKAPCVIAHNLSYDMEMIDIEFERLGIKIAWPKLRICTVEQTVHMKGFRLSLSALHQELFGEPFTGAHRAKVDVQALSRCCCELFKREMI